MTSDPHTQQSQLDSQIRRRVETLKSEALRHVQGLILEHGLARTMDLLQQEEQLLVRWRREMPQEPPHACDLAADWMWRAVGRHGWAAAKFVLDQEWKYYLQREKHAKRTRCS